MIKKPIYTFSNIASTGLDKVPLNSIVCIEDGDVYGKGLLMQLIDKTGITSSSTVAEAFLSENSHKFIENNIYFESSSDFTAQRDVYYFVEAASDLTITMPLSPIINSKFTVLDSLGMFGTYVITMTRNGNTIMGIDEDMTLDVVNKEYKFIYTGTTWRVTQ